jgi:hypothetical protein
MWSNAICERVIGTLRREVLDRLLIVNEHHLRQVLTEYLRHYNTARPHRSLGQLTPAQANTYPPDPVNLAEHRIRRKQVLGGLTCEYYIAALPASVATGNAGHGPESYFRAPQGAEPPSRTAIPLPAGAGPAGSRPRRRSISQMASHQQVSRCVTALEGTLRTQSPGQRQRSRPLA